MRSDRELAVRPFDEMQLFAKLDAPAHQHVRWNEHFRGMANLDQHAFCVHTYGTTFIFGLPNCTTTPVQISHCPA